MFDFDEIEKTDPELLPGDWVEVRSLGCQGVVTSYCGQDGFYKLFLVERGEESRERKDLQKLGEKERCASLIRGMLAVTLDHPLFMAEANRMHAECVSATVFQLRVRSLVVPLSRVYSQHQVTDEWLNRVAGALSPVDEEIAALWERLGPLGKLLTYQKPQGDPQGAPSPSSSSTADPASKRRWVVVAPTGSVCSRLCAIVSAQMLAADLDRELLVDWRPCKDCGCGLEELLQLEHTWFRTSSPELLRQESCLHWASRVIHLWRSVLEELRKSGDEESSARKAKLLDFTDCHKKAFRRRLAYLVDPSSAKWRELPRLHGLAFDRLPDFLQVDCICVSASTWFYPAGAEEEANAAAERTWWISIGSLLPAPSVAQRFAELPPVGVNAICVHAERRSRGSGGGAAIAAQRSPDWLFFREMDKRWSEMEAEGGSGDFFLVTDDPALEEALRERYGERLLAVQRCHAEWGTAEAAQAELAELMLLGQGTEILGSHGSPLSGLAPLLHSAELLVLDIEAEGGTFRTVEGWAVDVEERERMRAAEVGPSSLAKDPSESMGFHICGSWDDWTSFTKLTTSARGGRVHTACVRVRQPPRVEEFYVAADSDPSRRFYPMLCSCVVMGPDDTEGAYWRVRVPEGCEWLEVFWDPSGGRCVSWELRNSRGEELAEAPEPALDKQELGGPFFLVGSWNNWQSFEEMQRVESGFWALVPLRQPLQIEEFQVALGHGWERRFHPARGSNAILGPANPANGCNWRVMPSAGSKWLGVTWDPHGARSIRCDCFDWPGGPSSPIPPLGRFFLVGSWDNWSTFVHLRPEATSNPHCRARIRVKEAPVTLQFQVVIDRDWQQRFWRNKKGTEILGPGNATGLGWVASVSAGCRWIEITWDPSGARSLQWRLIGGPNGVGHPQHITDTGTRAAELSRSADELQAGERQSLLLQQGHDQQISQQPGPAPSLPPPAGDVDLCVAQVYRYNIDGIDDFGWGCVYRNTQTMMEVLGHDAPPLPELTRAMGTGDEWLRSPGAQCAWVEPHDVAEYLRQHSSLCKSTRLLLAAGRESLEVEEGETEALMFCKDGTEAKYEVLNKAPNLLQEAPEWRQHARRLRQILVPHLLRARTPVLLDDKEAAFLVAGYRFTRERGPEYRILDPHYGQTYAHRNARPFSPALGPDQFGEDLAKDQWISARWVEEGLGMLNGYTPNPSWMMLLVN